MEFKIFGLTVVVEIKREPDYIVDDYSTEIFSIGVNSMIAYIPSKVTKKRLRKMVEAVYPGLPKDDKIPAIKYLRSIVQKETGGVISLYNAKNIVEEWMS